MSSAVAHGIFFWNCQKNIPPTEVEGYWQLSGFTYYRKIAYFINLNQCSSLLTATNASKSIHSLITCCQSNEICFQTLPLFRFLPENGTRVSDSDSSRIFIDFRLDSDSTWNDSRLDSTRGKGLVYIFISNLSLLSLNIYITDILKADRIRTSASIRTASRNSSTILSEQRIKPAERIT